MKTEVVIAVRSHGERHGWIHPLLTMWLINLSAEPRYQTVIHSVHGAPNPACAANLAAKWFLMEQPDAEWLAIVDNDVVPPSDMLRILDDLPDDVCLIGPISHMSQSGKTLIQQGCYGETFMPVDATLLCRQEVDRIGGCCWFIRRRVFADMQQPYFLFTYSAEDFMVVSSEDVWFQNEARQLGFKLYCDSRFIVQHFHTTDLSERSVIT